MLKMVSGWLFLILISIVQHVAANGSTDDISRLEYAFTTESLPTDDRYMCSIGNGHVATDVFSTNVYMNGLYNGENGESHRAQIPAWNNIRVARIPSEHNSTTNYTLDTSTGTFTMNMNAPKFSLQQRLYAHKFYTRALINQIIVETPATSGEENIGIAWINGYESEDIIFDNLKNSMINGRVIYESCGKTKTVENSKYQKETSTVCWFVTAATEYITVTGGQKLIHTHVMTVDPRREVALKEITDVLAEQDDDLYKKHVMQWEDLHKQGKIEIAGNLKLAKVVNGMWYYLMSSLPSLDTNQEPNPFFGLSPGGLSRGKKFMDYLGHNFWDTETWMYPPILLLQPGLAKQLLQYRIKNYAPARDLAILSNHKGIRFPWESAFTGGEVCPAECPECIEFEIHITGCIAFAARQYIAMTRDKEWLKNGGCNLTRSIAEFWASRVNYNNLSGFYDINNVMGPDEDHDNITNSVFTNVVAGYALYLGEYSSCLCEASAPQNPSWGEIAAQIALPYDSVLDYHPEFQEYERPTVVKQADVVLLGYPLMYEMNESTRKNDLMYYENVTRENGPAMTWSMHTVGHLRLGNDEHAAHLFNRSYQSYVRDPFKIWTEVIEPDIGAVNFITGMGGFLQSILFGYGGISMHLDRLEIAKPRLTPETTQLKINGIKYLGASLTLEINNSNVSLTVIDIDEKRPLVLIKGNDSTNLSKNMKVMLLRDEIYRIQSASPNDCPIPSDKIGQVKSDGLKLAKSHIEQRFESFHPLIQLSSIGH